MVRTVFDLYTVNGLSIGAITRRLNELGLQTRKQSRCWERSTVWAMLRNPAYRGMACIGKTASAPRQRITRPLRLKGGLGTRDSASHERPRTDWIEIPVPRWSARQPSRGRRSAWRRTNNRARVGPLSRAFYRASFTVSAVGMPSTAHRRAAALAKSITIAA